MFAKKIFNHKELLSCEINTKKYLNTYFYTKSLVRSNLMNIKVLDTSTNFYNIPRIDLDYLSLRKIPPLDGFSLFGRKTLYINKRNSVLRFESFLCGFSSQICLQETVYRFLLSLQQKSKNVQNSLIILKPIKGGFSSYCCGVIGFLPRSQGLLIMKKILFLSVKRQIKSEKSMLDFINGLLIKEKFINKYFLLRLPFNLGKATVYCRFKKNNFSLSHRKKKDFFAEYNFVFLFKNVNLLSQKSSGKKYLVKCENFKIKKTF
jgi:hypothetical protein